MLRLVPPGGYPLKVRQILRAFRDSLGQRGGADENLASLLPGLRSKYVFGASSGRAALVIVLRSLRRLNPERSVVALPAYTCFTVPAAIVRSRLKLYPVDIDPETLDFDFSQLEAVPTKDLLCIMTSNLFGLVNDVARARGIARTKDVFLVDDAAQALGATRDGYLSGTCGDVGIYSLGRGKSLAAIEGGLIVTDSEEMAGLIQAELLPLPGTSRSHSAWLFCQMLAYSILLNPRLYWIPDGMPFLKLGATEFAPEFRIAVLPALSRAVVKQSLNSLADLNGVRRNNAAAIGKSLHTNGRFRTPSPAPGSLPTYVRFPVIAKDAATRATAISRLRAAGIGGSPYYPSAICDIPGIERYMATPDFHCPLAEGLSRRLLTLPVHPLVGEGDLRRMIAILNDVRPVERRKEA